MQQHSHSLERKGIAEMPLAKLPGLETIWVHEETTSKN